MSQYSRPLAVLVGAPVTLVGPLALGFAAALSAGAAWATARLASASSAMARMTVFIVVSPFLISHVPASVKFFPFGSTADPKLLWPQAAVPTRASLRERSR